MKFQKLLSGINIPKEWKCANITPLYTKGPVSDVSNYRPVNLTSVSGNLTETASRVLYMEENKLLSDTRHGFRQARSCVKNN
ncbi:hypothetical protein HOLleu_43577 [Holothuria leucospilota]|uniref:Reverse transcriptase domain-containing protein n=1 Tax=Holothuria leucospilota TaxID=206669 RepID=A0A9Q1BAZ9_HOLLE|nr:hypothetical protein HOLleu_43577 [Holothuria leucospilota]